MANTTWSLRIGILACGAILGAVALSPHGATEAFYNPPSETYYNTPNIYKYCENPSNAQDCAAFKMFMDTTSITLAQLAHMNTIHPEYSKQIGLKHQAYVAVETLVMYGMTRANAEKLVNNAIQEGIQQAKEE